MKRDEPLYRKVNTRARGVHHHSGPDFAHQRNGKAEAEAFAQGITRGRMSQGKQRGLDYTPLFRFLLSKVGQDWDKVYAAARARLDHDDPIFWLVARSPEDRKSFVLIGDNSYFSGLYINDANQLAVVDPSLTVDQMEPSCACCTQTLNGVPFTRPYRANR